MKQASRLLPVPYVHVVFTVPEQLAPLALRNQRLFYNLLFRAASETLMPILFSYKRFRKVQCLQGGGQCVVFEDSMRDGALKVLRTASEIRRALVNGAEFELHYQPLMNIREATVYGVEALLRWNHPERGRVGPGDFIPLAEDGADP